MKKLLTFTLAATLSIGFAFAHSTKPATVSTPASKSSVPTSLATLAEVARENQQLREMLLALETESAELKSQIGYQQMMTKMFTSLNAQQHEDVLEEVKATISYVSTMTNVLLALQSNNNQEQLAEIKAQAEYQKTMSKALASLNAVSSK
jgi:hypothetical protein